MNEIERFYDEEYEEWERLAWHLPEFEVTRRYMQQYLAMPQRCWTSAAVRDAIPFFWPSRDMR